VPGTTIESTWANDTLEDVANELTNSLSRTGAGGMLAPFRIADGNVSAPGLSYLNETNTGLYRSGSGSAWMSVLGVNVAQFSTVGLTVPAGKAFTAQGNASVSGTFAVTGAVTFSSTLALTGALTATGGVLGNVTAASGTSTFNNVTINGDLDMNAGSAGTITNLPNPTNSGDAANKAYVDAQDALRLALTGGTLTGALAMSTNKITGLGTPTADGDAATKSYVDNVAQGIDAKASCLVATTANITLSGTQTIDGVSVTAGQRVLVKNQSDATQNGIYVCAASTWSRSTDADSWSELVAAFTFIEQGTTNANSGYICTVAAGGTLGSTAVTWSQFSGAGQITAGTGMSKTGNTLNVNTASASRIVVGADEIDLATTGVTASTYKSVTVDQWGRITAGTNPTTLSGFGISDAYTQSQTDTFLNAKLNLAGGTMSGAIAMGTNKITGMGDPTNAQDAATKNYIDTIFGSTTSAAASAAAAATSASNAASSASAASSSASSAASSAADAAASYDSFDDRYLGSKSADPTVDNDGNPLLTGALYWNSTVNEMRVYNGSAWVAAYLPAAGYAALASSNTFTANQVISTNSSSDALRITQTGAGNALLVEDSSNPDATPFVINSVGAVVIGKDAPINIAGSSGALQVLGNSGATTTIANARFSADATSPIFDFLKSRGASVGSLGIVSNNDSLGRLRWQTDDGTDFNTTAAQIEAFVDGTPGPNDMPGRLVFSTTADGASSPTERMRIDNKGNVGIGGTPSGATLEVGKNITGGTTWRGIYQYGPIQSDVTSTARYFQTLAQTQATSFTLATLQHYFANQNVLGAGSAVTNQYGYFADSSLTGATNNFGFYSGIASGTGRWNFYAAGTAANYFGGVTQFAKATQETKTAIGASDIDLSTGNYFSKTISGSTTFTVSNTAASGLVSAFVLDLTNGGSATVTWWSGVKWNAATPPTLTASGRDVLGFFTYDGGTTWNGFVLGQGMA